MNLIFMDEALDDIETIRDFLAHAGAAQVDDLVGEIYNAVERLLGFPEIGVRVNNSKEWGDVRDFFSAHYCLRYACYQNALYILRVWHQKENERNL